MVCGIVMTMFGWCYLDGLNEKWPYNRNAFRGGVTADNLSTLK